MGDTFDKRMLVWDVASGMMNASSTIAPDPITCVAWGGVLKDIKRRATDKCVEIAGPGPRHR